MVVKITLTVLAAGCVVGQNTTESAIDLQAQPQHETSEKQLQDLTEKLNRLLTYQKQQLSKLNELETILANRLGKFNDFDTLDTDGTDITCCCSKSNCTVHLNSLASMVEENISTSPENFGCSPMPVFLGRPTFSSLLSEVKAVN